VGFGDEAGDGVPDVGEIGPDAEGHARARELEALGERTGVDDQGLGAAGVNEGWWEVRQGRGLGPQWRQARIAGRRCVGDVLAERRRRGAAARR
jgi:hypothetical protein